MNNFKKIAIMLITAVSLTQLGCTTSQIMPSNPQFAKAGDVDFATVYMIRPNPIRTRGVADNDINIEFGEHQRVAELSAGEYVAFKVKPGAMDIIIRSETYLTTKPLPVKVWRARNFKFKPKKNYFILTKFTQEEFRGIYFIPVEIQLADAKAMLMRMIPAGVLARQKPLESL